jgi:hypothetical protein
VSLAFALVVAALYFFPLVAATQEKQSPTPS